MLILISMIPTTQPVVPVQTPILFFKHLLISTLLLLFLTTSAMAQSSGKATANPDDVASVDAIITALYDVISGPIGKQRNWARFRSLMKPSARLMPVFTNRDGVAQSFTWTLDEYVERVDSSFKANGFFEVERARKTERYGNLVHAFSTYESRHKAEDPEPFSRGINSIQVIYEQGRWWIVNIAWQPEQSGLPIPDEYLPGTH